MATRILTRTLIGLTQTLIWTPIQVLIRMLTRIPAQMPIPVLTRMLSRINADSDIDSDIAEAKRRRRAAAPAAESVSKSAPGAESRGGR